MRAVKFNTRWLLALVPVALAIERIPQASAPLVFIVAALAILPVAQLISESTEQLSGYTGESVGGLLNASFGNLPELIIGVAALRAGLYDMVAASLVGAILFNLLLVLGLSLLLAGLRNHTLDFNAGAVRIYSSMMFIAVLSMAIPSIHERVADVGGHEVQQDGINLGIAVLLIVLYGLYLFFSIRTHPELFATVREAHAAEGARWTRGRSLGALVLASVLAAVLSEVLVGSIEATGEALGLSTPFLGIILLASVGGAGEGFAAISMAWKGRIDLSLSIALGSCILIALFVAPMLVFVSYLLGERPFHLSFSGAGIGMLLLTVIIAEIVASGGSGNWYKGVQLITVYALIALLLYTLPL